MNKEQSSKIKNKKKNKKMIKREIGLKKFVFRVRLEKNWLKLIKRREQPIETRQTTNKSIPPIRKGFYVKKHTEHGLLRTILIQILIS